FLNSGPWNGNQPVPAESQIQQNHPIDLPQVFSIDRSSLQNEPSGITRRITTPTKHLANLHVSHSKSGKSQLGIQDTTLEFLTHFGGPGEDAGKGIVVDEDGNSYVTGYFDTGDPKQGTDVFVAKLDAAGKNLLWFTTFGGPGRDEGHGIARDNKGNLYIVGT